MNGLMGWLGGWIETLRIKYGSPELYRELTRPGDFPGGDFPGDSARWRPGGEEQAP